VQWQARFLTRFGARARLSSGVDHREHDAHDHQRQAGDRHASRLGSFTPPERAVAKDQQGEADDQGGRG
jgi:hypothetical protein